METIDRLKPNVIILDLFMPGPNGIVLLHEMQSHADLSRIPIILISNAAGDLSLDPATHRLTAGGKPVTLGPTEFRLLHFLMTHPERVHSRAQLLDQVWGDHVFVEERTVDVHIRRLRCALEPSLHDGLVQTVRGSGYRFSTQQESPAVAR